MRYRSRLLINKFNARGSGYVLERYARIRNSVKKRKVRAITLQGH